MSLGRTCVPILIFCVGIAWSPGTFGREPKKKPAKIAVLDLVVRGVPPDRAQGISTGLGGIVAAEATRRGFDVVSTADINAMLSYQRKKELLGCEDDTSCLADIGGALGADFLIGGSISKLGSLYVISLSLIDIKGVRVRARFEDSAGDEQVLSITVRRGVGLLFQKGNKRAGTGLIFVKTNPPGATVSVDGEVVGVAPVMVEALAVGDHLIEVRLGDRIRRSPIYVLADSVQRLRIDLDEKPPVKLLIVSTPPEANVAIDGVELGKTPFLTDDIPAGEHVVRLRAEGFQPLEETLRLSYDEFEAGGRVPLRYEASLAPIPIEVVVEGLPVEAQLLVDGAPCDESSLLLEPGRHTIAASAAHHMSRERVVDLRAGSQPMRLAMTLRPHAKLEVTLPLPVDGASVLLDGENVDGETVFISPGRHHLQVRAPGYKDLHRVLHVSAEQRQVVVSASLEMLPAYASYLNARQRNRRLKAYAGLVAGVSLAAGVAAGVKGHRRKLAALSAFDRYKGSRDVAEMNTSYQKARRQMREARQMTLWAYALCGVGAVATVAGLYGHAKRPVFRTEVGESHAVGVTVVPTGSGGVVSLWGGF